jgi:hypothetical protein
MKKILSTLILIMAITFALQSCSNHENSENSTSNTGVASGTNSVTINGKTTTSTSSISIDTTDPAGNHVSIKASQTSNGQNANVQIIGNGNKVSTEQK